MAHFVQCDEGWVNLDHVAEIREVRRQDHAGGRRSLIFESDAGKIIARQTWPCSDMEEVTAPVVAAGAGSVAIVVGTFANSDGVDERPDSAEAEQMPIVAWRLMYGGAIPVLVQATTGNETVLISLPDGRLLLPEDTTFADLDEAKRCLLLRAQAAWDRSHAKSEPI